MSENCAAAAAAIDPWAAWISDSFARDNEALTRALQISLSSVDSTVSTPSPVSADDLSSFPSSLIDLIKPEPTAFPLNPHPGSNRQAVTAAPATGRISKKKSQASKRCPTTYINTDPANFHQMVQQVV